MVVRISLAQPMSDQIPPQPDSAPFGTVPQASESFRTVPNVSEPFRTIRNDSESFRNVPHPSERKENHSLTVREAARMFETAGVARTERSITNWCQVNAQGIARLDAYFDPNERKYYITPQSVELAIAEEKAKAAKINPPSEPVGSVPHDSETNTPASEANPGQDTDRVRKLEKELMDSMILNKGKDFLIEQLKQERDGFFGQLLDASRKVGELETKILQLHAPEPRRLRVNRSDEIPGEADLKSPSPDQSA